jgi:hypothetical protein
VRRISPFEGGHSAYIEVLWIECCYKNTIYYVAGCYHPPKPRYLDRVLVTELTRDIEILNRLHVVGSQPAVVVLAGDFNNFDTEFLEVDLGLAQIVNVPTHGNKTLDKFFTSRPDISHVEVFSSLIKTKHKAVCIKLALSNNLDEYKNARNRTKVYDLRPHFIDYLRYCIGVHDWSPLLSCNDVQIVYDEFLCTLKHYVDHCIPVKIVRAGRKDPAFISPYIKMLLLKRNKMRSKGNWVGADKLAATVNLAIATNLSNRFNRLADAPVKEMWTALKPKASGANSGDRNSKLLSDVDLVNNYFANISFDPLYNVNNVNAFRRFIKEDEVNVAYYPLYSYEVEQALSRVAKTASGSDNIPFWVFKECSFELAEVVSHIFNTSLTSGTVPSQWLTAVITPVPKSPNPATLSDFRPISVTPILSRILERFVVTRWLQPAIPKDLISDQFAFRPTGSTTCALTHFMHHVSCMLETNSYVRCLLVDFSKAFDTVDHVILIEKLDKLELPSFVHNWLISFLTGRSHTTKVLGFESCAIPINLSIVQGSAIGPSLYIVLESDLKPVSNYSR